MLFEIFLVLNDAELDFDFLSDLGSGSLDCILQRLRETLIVELAVKWLLLQKLQLLGVLLVMSSSESLSQINVLLQGVDDIGRQLLDVLLVNVIK